MTVPNKVSRAPGSSKEATKAPEDNATFWSSGFLKMFILNYAEFRGGRSGTETGINPDVFNNFPSPLTDPGKGAALPAEVPDA